MHVLSDREFQIGLTMSGAISAGAYTAGVLDFLIEALDAWEDARKSLNGDEVPNHRVGIKVMSGASAGAITSAIAAIALADAEESGKPRAPGAFEKIGFTYRYHLPKLYETWVVKPAFVAETPGETDFLSLTDLGDAPSKVGDFTRTSDVPPPAPGKPMVASALNSRLLDEIAASALQVKAVMTSPRAYVSSNLHIYLTLSNLRGVPYKVEFSGGDYHMISHGDRVHYAISNVGAWETRSAFADDDKLRPLSALSLPARDKDKAWKDYAVCALASSAFPAGLSPRQIGTILGPANDRDAGEYGKRKFPNANLLNANIYPDWRPPELGQASYWFASADGGIIDNDPFEYAHFSLKDDGKLGEPIPSGQSEVDRAVIMISPFPEAKPILAEGRPQLDILSILTAVFPALIDQARFKPDQLALALDENHGSRYLIGPRREVEGDPGRQERYTIASGLLSGFGGFVSRSFRDFDFQLGRLNCQRFLEESFAVPGDNKIVSSWPASVKRENFAARKLKPEEETTYRLIPLYGSAASPVELPKPWPRVSSAEFETLMTRIAQRFDGVAPLLVEQNVSGLLGEVVKIALHGPISAIPGLIRDKALHFARLYIMADLVRRDQIEGWQLPPFQGISGEDIRLALAELLNPRFDFRNAAGIFAAIRPAAAHDLTKEALEAALVQLKAAAGKPFQVAEAAISQKTPAGERVPLYTLSSRKPWWEIGFLGPLVDGVVKPAVDPPPTAD